MKHFETIADRETGEWLSQPKLIGEVDASEWNAKVDTEYAHYDTYEIASDEGTIEPETAAITVRWAD